MCEKSQFIVKVNKNSHYPFKNPYFYTIFVLKGKLVQ